MGWKHGIGRGGLFLVAILAFAMCLLSFILHPVDIIPIQYGLCLDSPDSWQINPIFSWILNTILIGVITLILYLINKSYNFIRTTEPALYAVFIIMASSSSWLTQGLNTSTLLCLVNTVCLGVIFDAYDTRNATRQLFILGMALGIGSMFQYAFLPMACVFILWALFMKVLRFKELLAFLLGLACPYWITLGLGWLHFSDFHLPSLVSLFTSSNDHSDILFLLLGIGLATILGVLAGLPNSMKLYAGNSKVNSMNLCVSSLGVASLICILVDYENIPAYVMTLYLATAVQIANICALWKPRYEWTVSAIPAFVFILIFVANLFL